jgi:hypothetical protein
MFSIPRSLGVVLAALPFALLPTPAHPQPAERLIMLCAPSFAPEGYPCSSVGPGYLVKVRFPHAVPRGSMLRFLPNAGRGRALNVLLAAGPVHHETARFPLPARLCTDSKATPFQVDVFGADRSLVGSAGEFTVMCGLPAPE